jgi:hypothetical protein
MQQHMENQTLIPGSHLKKRPENRAPTLWLPIGSAFSLLILIAIGFGALLATKHAPTELLLRLTVTFGVGALLLMLFLIAIGFSRLQLDDKTQALGLPRGSVRALIAFYLGSSSTKTPRTQGKPAAPAISKIFPLKGPGGKGVFTIK